MSDSSSKHPILFSPNVTVRRRQRRPMDLDEIVEKENEQDDLEKIDVKDETAAASVEMALKRFQKAAASTCQASFWKSSSKLARTVVQLSLQDGNNKSQNEKTSTISKSDESLLLASARKVIKEATEGQNIEACLCVGLHVLRSLRCFEQPERIEAVFRCLYHIIKTGETAATSNDKKNMSICSQYSLVAFETLGNILLQYSCAVKGKPTQVVKFEMSASSTSFFPVPRLRKRLRGCPAPGELPIDQLAVIGIHTTIAIARILSKPTTCRDDPQLQEFRDSLPHPIFQCSVHDSVVHLLQCVLPSWVSLLAPDAPGVHEKDIFHHCKSSYQILLQLASDSTDPDRCLDLRKEAILALIAVNLDPKLQAIVVDKFFDLACSSAYKFSATYALEQSIACPVGSSHGLAVFHERIGTVLDAAAARLPTDFYMEYCAIRALHVGIDSGILEKTCCSSSRCLFRCLDGCCYTHKDCASDVNAMIIALFFTSLKILDHLDGNTTKEYTHGDDELIIDEFAEHHTAASHRHFKLLCLAPLQRRIQERFRSDDDSHLMRTQQHKQELDAAASILIRCMIPLAFADSQLAQHEERGWDSLYTCFCSATTLLESLGSGLHDDSYSKQSDALIGSVVHDLLSGRRKGCPSDSFLESMAKLLSSTGKRRQNRKSKPLVPLLSSIKLFLLLPPGRRTFCQLSTRWTYLASIYKSEGLLEECFLAHAYALACDERDVEADWSGTEYATKLLQRLSDAAGWTHRGDSDVEPVAVQRSVLVSRLVNAYLELPDHVHASQPPNKARKATVLAPSSAVDMLLDAANGANFCVSGHFETECGMSFSLAGIIKAAVPPTTTSSNPTRACLLDRFVVIQEVVSYFGHAVYQQVKRSGDSSGLSQYKELSNMGASYVRKIAEKDQHACSVTLAMFYAVCATAISFPHRSMRSKRLSLTSIVHDQPTTSFASGALAMALNSLQEVSPGVDDLCVFASSIAPEVALLIQQLRPSSKLDADGGLLAVVRAAYEALKSEDSESPIICLAKEIVTGSFSRACDLLNAEGEKLHAYEVAILGRHLAVNQPTLLPSWFEATAYSLESDETVLMDHSPAKLGVTEPRSYSLSELEAIIGRLRHDVRLVNMDCDWVNCRNELFTMCGHVEGMIAGNSDAIELALLHWYRGTCEFGLSELAGRHADFEMELHFARACYRTSQASVSSFASGLKLSHGKGDQPPWQRAMIDGIATRLRQRDIACRLLLADVYVKSGDWRKSSQYAFSAVQLTGPSWCDNVKGHLNLQRLVSLCRSSTCTNSLDIQLRRMTFRIVAGATAIDRVRHEFKDDFTIGTALNKLSKSRVGLNWELDGILCEADVLTILSASACAPLYPEHLSDLYLSVKSRFEAFLIKPTVWDMTRALRPVSFSVERLAPSIPYKLKLHEAQVMLLDPIGDDSHEHASRMLHDIVHCPFAPDETRAVASFSLGTMQLSIAREQGWLLYLWRGNSNIDWDEESIPSSDASAAARGHFQSAIHFAGSSSCLLTRKCLRCLALLAGPDASFVADSACALTHASIGRELRLAVAQGLKNQASSELSGSDKVEWTLRALDMVRCKEATGEDNTHEFFRLLNEHVPTNWRVVGMAICPTGELMLSALQLGPDGNLCYDTVCLFPEAVCQEVDLTDPCSDAKAYKTIVAPLDDIVEKVNRHLEDVPNNSSTEDKREWWNQRSLLDGRLQDHIDFVEKKWFESDHAVRALFGSLARSNLSSRFDAALDGDELPLGDQRSCPTLQNKTLLLILDENLHRFPFEGMACMEGHAVCRPPSLPLVLAKLYETKSPALDSLVIESHNVSYILDPESNLRGTTDRNAPFLETLNERHGSQWKYVIRERPTSEFIKAQLSARDGLLLYMGHGSGCAYFSRKDIEGMIGQHELDGTAVSERGIKSSVILVGCSSGRLESVNRKDTSDVMAELPIIFEPEGIAQSYIAAGAPCVVANLWDVTDRDIDSFSTDMLSRFFLEEDMSLPECVALARSACKMKYIVGCAPVCYGLPVTRR